MAIYARSYGGVKLVCMATVLCLTLCFDRGRFLRSLTLRKSVRQVRQVEFAEGRLQPVGKAGGPLFNFGLQLIYADPLPVVGFKIVRSRILIIGSDENVIELPFDQFVIELRSVNETRMRPELAIEVHLFSQPPAGSRLGRLAGARLPATGVRPEPARVILRLGPLLKQKPPQRVEHEYRKSSVQPALAMDLELFPGPDLLVILIYQYQLFHAECLYRF